MEVVIDEIESYNDSPAELIYDEFENFVFPNHPLGRRILGDAERLRQFDSEDLHRFVRRLYHPSRTVLFVLGDVTMKQVVKSGGELRVGSGGLKVESGGLRVERILNPYYEKPFPTHQAHVVVGARAFAMDDPRHRVLYLLNNILGGPGMNARLNLALRERRGLVYTVESSITAYTDTGLWTTYFGCDHKDVERCLHLIHNELRRLTDAPLSASALAVAKRQLQGQAALSWENGENVAIAMGCRLLHLGRTQTLREFCQAVEEVTATQLLDVAQQVFNPDKLFTLRYVNK